MRNDYDYMRRRRWVCDLDEAKEGMIDRIDMGTDSSGYSSTYNENVELV